jgi:transposase
VKFILTPGQQDDSTKATALLEGLTPKKVIADKRYDSNQILKAIEQTRAEAVIPPTAKRTVQRPYNKKLYRERNQIERLIARLKQCRRVATRYEKTARNFLAFVQLAASMILLA